MLPGPRARSFAIAGDDGAVRVVGVGAGDLASHLPCGWSAVGEVIEFSPHGPNVMWGRSREGAWAIGDAPGGSVIRVGGVDVGVDEVYAGLELDPC